MAKSKEIERKFLLDRKATENFLKLVPSNQIKKVDIEQFYVQLQPEEIRYRRYTIDGKDSYVKTIKSPNSSLSRDEEEYPVDFIEYENYIKSSTLIVNKRRYIVDGKLEIDFYPSGLTILEKEYSSIKEATEDELKYKFIRKEVTGNKFYSNASIAQRKG